MAESAENVPIDCPVCSQELELHPIMEYWSCFSHGDYIFENGSWTWTPLHSLSD